MSKICTLILISTLFFTCFFPRASCDDNFLGFESAVSATESSAEYGESSVETVDVIIPVQTDYVSHNNNSPLEDVLVYDSDSDTFVNSAESTVSTPTTSTTSEEENDTEYTSTDATTNSPTDFEDTEATETVSEAEAEAETETYTEEESETEAYYDDGTSFTEAVIESEAEIETETFTETTEVSSQQTSYSEIEAASTSETSSSSTAASDVPVRKITTVVISAYQPDANYCPENDIINFDLLNISNDDDTNALSATQESIESSINDVSEENIEEAAEATEATVEATVETTVEESSITEDGEDWESAMESSESSEYRAVSEEVNTDDTN